MNHELIRGITTGMLIMMVARGVFWTFEPHPDATTGNWAVEIATVAICGLTALVNLRPPRRLQEKIQQIVSLPGR